MRNINNYYAVPVLANVPVVQFGEGDFAYNGMRGLAGLGQTAEPTWESKFGLPSGSLPWLVGAVGVGIVAWAAWNR